MELLWRKAPHNSHFWISLNWFNPGVYPFICALRFIYVLRPFGPTFGGDLRFDQRLNSYLVPCVGGNADNVQQPGDPGFFIAEVLFI